MYLDEISHWFQVQGVHPVLGGIIIGFLVAKIFSRRAHSSNLSIDAAPGVASASAFRVPSSHASTQIVSSTISIDPQISEQIVTALKKGDKIEAIKLFRAATGAGLTEAKSAVEGIEIQALNRK